MLLGQDIIEARAKGDILIEPYNEKFVGPNSYDVRLGSEILIYDMQKCEEGVLDVKKQNPIIKKHIHRSGMVLYPKMLYLGHTIERAGSNKYIPMYEGRSSMARLGIQSHISAGFGDIGFDSQWTLELSVVHPVRVYAGMRIGQIYFVQPKRLIYTCDNDIRDSEDVPIRLDKLYKGKYVGQSGSQSSLSFQDFE